MKLENTYSLSHKDEVLSGIGYRALAKQVIGQTGHWPNRAKRRDEALLTTLENRYIWDWGFGRSIGSISYHIRSITITKTVRSGDFSPQNTAD